MCLKMYYTQFQELNLLSLSKFPYWLFCGNLNGKRFFKNRYSQLKIICR